MRAELKSNLRKANAIITHKAIGHINDILQAQEIILKLQNIERAFLAVGVTLRQ